MGCHAEELEVRECFDGLTVIIVMCYMQLLQNQGQSYQFHMKEILYP